MLHLRAVRLSLLLVGIICLLGGAAWATAATAGERTTPAPPRPPCPAGSQVNVVAHPDDDLLFMNPDLLRRVAAAGWCTTTVVVTAGDAGEGIGYTQDRERGLRAAYATMAGVPDEWTTDTPEVEGHRVERSVLTAAPQVRLEFLRLPDGNLDGSGFPSTGPGSVQMLADGRITELSTVDPWPRSQTYTAVSLRSVLRALLEEGEPTVIRTLDYVHPVGADDDHSDHHVVAADVLAARNAVAPSVTIVPYLGYSSVERAPNLTGADLRAKRRAFFAYAPSDRNECQTLQDCAQHPDGKWLRRMYQADGGTEGATAGEARPTPSPEPTSTGTPTPTAAG